MDKIACKRATLSYYETWLGKQGCLANGKSNQLIYTSERNVAQAGHSTHKDIYVWVEPGRVVVSYGDAAKAKISALENLNGDVFKIAETLHELFGSKPTHAVKYFYQEVSDISAPRDAFAITLTANDYADFETFWLSCFPNNKGDWLQEYFEDMVKYEFCVGVYADGVLASCTDAATMPYMVDQLQEIGINTLEKYRGKGYAAIACHGAAVNILRGGRYPIWSHSYTNVASQHIAQKLGFVKLADVLTLTV